MRKPCGAFALALALAFLSGCGTDDDVSSSPEVVNAKRPVQLRLVAASPANPSADSAVPDEWVQRFQTFTCPTGVVDEPDPDEYAVVCDTEGLAYLLSPASWSGTVKSASALIPDKQVAWVVDVDFDDEGTRVLADLSSRLVGTGEQCALVLDGRVLSAPTFNAVITDGKTQIQGAFTEADAKDLAAALSGR